MALDKVCMVLVGKLPVPAVLGGAVETLAQHLLEQNEKDPRVEFTVLTVDEPKARAVAAVYRHARFVWFKPHVLWNKVWWRVRTLGLKLTGPEKELPFPYQRLEAARWLKKHQGEFDYILAESELEIPYWGKVPPEKVLYHLHWIGRPTQWRNERFGHLLAVSSFVAENWKKITGLSDERVTVLPNCVDVNKFTHLPADADENARLRRELGFAEDDFVVLYCGRTREEKGVHRLVEAMVKIDDPKVKLLIIGSPFFAAEDDSPFFERMRTEAEPLRQAGRIQFTGYLHNDCLPAYYRLADLACFPAIWEEPAGIVAIEAMACGCPIVTTASGGMGEYLAGSGAALVSRDEDWHPDGSIPVPGVEPLDDQLARVIAELKADPDHRARMAQAGIEQAKKFSRQAYYQNFLAALYSIGLEDDVL